MTSKNDHQDGGIGRYTLPPQTTKRRTTNLKTKNNQTCQKIELYGSLTTKELKKKHLFRLVGEAERMHSKAAAGGPGGRGGGWRLHICVQINQEEKLGSETDHATQGSSMGKPKPQSLWL